MLNDALWGFVHLLNFFQSGDYFDAFFIVIQQ